MEKMNDLKDLLRHEIQDLYSAEEQIIKAMPAMIEKAKNPELKKSLKDHLRVTEQQRTRLEQVQRAMGEGGREKESGGLFSRLMMRRHVCRGMQGILEEGEKIMAEDMSAEVMDAAIIAAAQKVEHYEICGYGTARAYAQELNLTEVANLLQQTLDEEYAADDLLTRLAVSRINEQAEGRRSTGGQMTSERSRTGTGMREGVRSTTREMEMVSGNRGAGAKGTAAGRSSGPTGSATRGDTTGRGATAAKGTTAGSRTAKTATKGTGRNGGTTSGRGTTGNTRGRQ